MYIKPFFMISLSIKFEDVKILLSYRSRALKSRGSYGNSALFLKTSQHIRLDFQVLSRTAMACYDYVQMTSRVELSDALPI